MLLGPPPIIKIDTFPGSARASVVPINKLKGLTLKIPI